jgi:hypothetical protein
MTRRILTVAAIALGLLAGGCEEAAHPDAARGSANPEKYARDRDLCQAQSDDYMKTRRRVDDASAGSTFANPSDRGRDGLSNQMSSYDDSRNSDKFMASCMDGRGWPQAQQRPWWQRIGG